MRYDNLPKVIIEFEMHRLVQQPFRKDICYNNNSDVIKWVSPFDEITYYFEVDKEQYDGMSVKGWKVIPDLEKDSILMAILEAFLVKNFDLLELANMKGDKIIE